MIIQSIITIILIIPIILSQDCQLYGLRLSLGHYYSNLRIDTDALRIVFNSQNKCEKQLLLIVNDNNFTQPNILFLNMTDYYKETSANIQYETYIYTFKIPFLNTQIYNYTLIYDNQIQFQAIIKLPLLEQQQTKVLFFGDMDSSWVNNRSKSTFDWLQNSINNKSEFDSILFTGDMAYDLESENCLRGQQWLKNISLFTSQYPFMVAPGNHDGGFNYKQMFLRNHFQMLYLSEYDTPQYQNEIFSFDIGIVHFIQYDPVMIVYKADPNNYIKNRMLIQFRKDLELAQCKRNEIPWIVVFSHYPLYCNYMDDDQCVNNFKYLKEFEELFQEFNVDLYVSGHQHNYQRNQPYFQNHSASFSIDDNIISDYESPVSIIEGAGGADYGPEMMKYNDQPYTVKQLDKNGFGFMQAINSTHLLYQHIQASTNEVMDEFWIVHNIQNNDESEFETWKIILMVFGVLFLLSILGVKKDNKRNIRNHQMQTLFEHLYFYLQYNNLQMGDKKKKGDQVEDFSTEQLNKLYRKRCENNGVPLCKIFKERLESVCSEGEHLPSVKLWEEMGPVGVRSMMEAFTEVGYKHLKQLRLWRVKCQDEGVRTICIYIDKMRLLEILDLLDNQIGVLGCKFLSDILHPRCENKLVKLKLDHNQIGSEGLAELAKGLAMNNTLESLALNYCGIEADGARYLQDILANVNSKLYKLKLSGNRLKNEGTYELFRALEINNTLERIKLADNQFHSDPNDSSLISKIVSTMEINKTLGYYDLKFNLLSDEDATKIIPCIEKNKSIFFIEISDQISKPLTDKLKSLTKKRKPKKKKKSKKKK